MGNMISKENMWDEKYESKQNDENADGVWCVESVKCSRER